MNIYVTIYSIIAVIWTAFIMYSYIAGKFLKPEEKELMDLIKGSTSNGGWIIHLVIATVSEFLFWPISMITKFIVVPLVKRHYQVPQD